MVASVSDAALKRRVLWDEGFLHQKVNVPGPVTVVCKVDVVEAPGIVPLVAQDTPSWGEEVVVDHPKEVPVPLVVQVRFVALRAWPNVAPCRRSGIAPKAATRSNRANRCVLPIKLRSTGRFAFIPLSREGPIRD